MIVGGFVVPQYTRAAALLRHGFTNIEYRDLLKDALGMNRNSFKFKTIILIAVDSRASMGQYIGLRTVKKIIGGSPFY